MTAGLKPYPEYKDSGLPWLGRVPDHWDMTRMKHLFRERNVRAHPNEPLLAATQTKGVVRKEDYGNRTVLALKDLHLLKLVEIGDFVISLRSFQGGIEHARHRGIISPAYTILYPNDDSAHGYFAALFKSQSFIDALRLYVTGIRQGQNIDYAKLSRSPLPVPPREEQQAISAFARDLDRKCVRFIRNRRRLIEVLNEQKQAIINRAVTRGLAPNAPLKPSGIDWLGDIPEHWEMKRLKYLADIGTGGRDTVDRKDNGAYPFFVRSQTVERIDTFSFDGEAVLTAGDGAGVAKVFHHINGKFDYHQRVYKFSGFKKVTGRFFYFFFSNTLRFEAFRETAKSTVDSLRLPMLKNFPVPLPPHDEQDQIVAWIEKETAAFDDGVARAKGEIDLIREYRTRLIADVVTGKLDVRQASATAVAVKQTKRSANVHFRRSVFAAEIVHRLHDEPTFGHVKFEKLVFLCEKRCGVDIGSTYHRQAAGPYDNRALRSIDSQIKKQGWYEARKDDKGYRYVPLEKAGAHKDYFDRYFSNVITRFDEIIDIFRKAKTSQCEIVATLYAAWEDLLPHGDVTDDQIIEQVLHHWHPSKQKIDEDRWRRALGWMKAKGLTPEMGVTSADD